MSGEKISRGFADTAEGQLQYRRFGRGEPIIMLMTLPFNTSMFHPLMRILGDHYDCIAIDLMGQGGSDKRERAWTVEDHARAIWEVADSLGLAGVRILSGHFTAQVAVEAAILRPDQVIKLFLDGVVAWSLEEGGESAKAFAAPPFWMSAKYLSGEWEYAQALFMRLDPELQLSAANIETIAGLGFSYIMSRLGGPAGQSMFDYDMMSRLPLLRVPTVLIGSPSDSLRSQHEKAFAVIPNGEQYIFETINPLYQFDQPERAQEYAAMLRHFLPE